MNIKAKAALVILIMLVAAGVLLVVTKQGAQQAAAPTTQGPQEQKLVSSVKVALLDYSNEMAGKQRGCDMVILEDRAVSPTADPLSAALGVLFATQESEGELASFMPKTAATLSLEKAEVSGGVAKIYLAGSLSGLAGVCDNPRAKIQLEETALAVPGVQSVELYLNGQQTELQPNEQG